MVTVYTKHPPTKEGEKKTISGVFERVLMFSAYDSSLDSGRFHHLQYAGVEESLQSVDE